MFMKALFISLLVALITVIYVLVLTAKEVTNIRQGPDISANWSGYVYSGGYYTDIAGSFDVPVQTVPSGAASEWVGIGGYGTPTIIQAGVDELAGNPQPEAWVELYPGPSQLVPLAVRAGDEVSVSIDQMPSNSAFYPDHWMIAMRVVQPSGVWHTWSHMYLYQQRPSTAEWITESPSIGGIVTPMGDYGTVYWQHLGLDYNPTMGPPGKLHRVQLGSPGQPASIPSRTFSWNGFATRWAP